MEPRKLIIRLGQHTINLIFPSSKINFRFFPQKLKSNAIRELTILKALSRVNVPKILGFYELDHSTLIIREYIPGEYFSEFLKKSSTKQLRHVIIRLIQQLYLIEEQGVYLPEFSSLSKNVIVNGDEPFIIDVERGKFSSRPIITKFLAFLKNLAKNPNYRDKIEQIIDLESIDKVSSQYKKNRDINLVLSIIRSEEDHSPD